MSEEFGMSDATVSEIADAVRAGSQLSEDLVETVIRRVEILNPALNAVCYRDYDTARRQAREIDAKVRAGIDPGPLAGIPLGVKDLENARGMPTCFGSVFHTGAAPASDDSPHVERLRAAGAIPLVKTTTAEYGFAGNCDTILCGTTRNPWNLDKTPGGSSGGSAAAVAAGMIPLCTGGDGGGSLRAPAAFCGLVGLKASHGRVPTPNGIPENTGYGVVTTTVRDMARCLDVMSGPHLRDRMTLPLPGIQYEQVMETLAVSGLRVAWSTDLEFAEVDTELADITHHAAQVIIREAGLDQRDVQVEFPNVLAAMGAVYTHRIESRLRCEGLLPGRWEELSPEVRRSFDGFRASNECELIRAQDVLTDALARMAALFEEIDVLLTPTTATPAFAAAGPAPTLINGRDASRTLDAPLTPLANYSWNPSISVPAGVTRSGLPVGVMITAARHRDDVVLRLARLLEQARPWPRHSPSIQ
ncbi:amidase [Haliea sp. E1-2-M8]|uniref:amidase n=1 Tax=Haliea sp. E1-2-M8 TaxID=3064706 RepID=UPI0027208374|nr:amidase [Haliea sp. E1-2-M8]MDO8861996.1 amidase [Haliea sp. E1-2-M8]